MNIARLREGWSSLETRSQITLVGAVLGVLVTFYLLYSMSGGTSYVTLASNLDPSTTGKAETTLATAGVPYKVAAGGTEIDVPSSALSQARIALSTKGVLGTNADSSFSAFNKSSLGTTDFQQQVQYQTALQDEIAQTIEQIQGVNSATVTLVLPQDTLFADQQSKASAAVLVGGGDALDASTVAGIAHLVSSSVKGLDSANVTITSDSGALLWPNAANGGTGGTGASSKLQADSTYSSQLAAQVNAMLTSTLGPNKAVAQVHADLNVDQTTLDKVTYAKKGVPLTQQTQSESLNSKGGAAQLPAGATTNTTTGSYAATTSGNGQSQYKNRTSTTTYGIDKTIQHSVVAPGTVNKVDVALMVDSSVPAAEVASLQKSVASLVGLTPARGDTLAVTRMAFAKPATATTAKSGPLTMIGNPIGIAKDVGIGLVALLFLFFMRRALKRREGEVSVAEPTWLRELERGMTVAELESGGPPPLALPSAADIERRNAVREQVEEIAANSPEAIASQVAAWMKE
jgi:flagellar M-ring protein FliF